MKTNIHQHTTNMRSAIYLLMFSGLITACGNNSDQSQLGDLISMRDSLQKVRSEVTAQIAEVEANIAAMDTTIKERVTNITAITASAQRFEHFFTAQGVVETDQNAQIFPEAAGKVISIAVAEGDRVSKGQVLLSIDNSIVVQQIQELKSRLSLAETVFKKQESLWNQKVGSEIQYLEAKNNYESLQRNLETLKAQADLYVITAPFSGVIDEITIKTGEMASPQFPAIRLVNTDKMYIKADITERYLGKIKSGDSVAVFFPSIQAGQTTTISRIGEFINPNNRTFKLRMELPNNKSNLKPNLLGELKIRDYANDSVIVIPASLVQMTPSGEEFVFIIEEGKAKKSMVETGLSFDDQVEILSGIEPGNQLIDKGARAIKEGDAVTIN